MRSFATDKLAQTAASQSVILIIGWLCNIVAMKFYELDKDRMGQVQKNIAEMKEQ